MNVRQLYIVISVVILSSLTSCGSHLDREQNTKQAVEPTIWSQWGFIYNAKIIKITNDPVSGTTKIKVMTKDNIWDLHCDGHRLQLSDVQVGKEYNLTFDRTNTYGKRDYRYELKYIYDGREVVYSTHDVAQEVLVYNKESEVENGDDYNYDTYVKKWIRDFRDQESVKRYYVGTRKKEIMLAVYLVVDPKTKDVIATRTVRMIPKPVKKLYEYPCSKSFIETFNWTSWQDISKKVDMDNAALLYDKHHFDLIEGCRQAWLRKSRYGKDDDYSPIILCKIPDGFVLTYDQIKSAKAQNDRMCNFIENLLYLRPYDLSRIEKKRVSIGAGDYIPERFKTLVAPIHRCELSLNHVSGSTDFVDATVRDFSCYGEDIARHQAAKIARRHMLMKNNTGPMYKVSLKKTRIGYVFYLESRKTKAPRISRSNAIVFSSGPYVVYISATFRSSAKLAGYVMPHNSSNLTKDDGDFDGQWLDKERSIYRSALEKLVKMPDEWVRDKIFSENYKQYILAHPVEGFDLRGLYEKLPSQRRTIVNKLLMHIEKGDSSH